MVPSGVITSAHVFAPGQQVLQWECPEHPLWGFENTPTRKGIEKTPHKTPTHTGDQKPKNLQKGKKGKQSLSSEVSAGRVHPTTCGGPTLASNGRRLLRGI